MHRVARQKVAQKGSVSRKTSRLGMEIAALVVDEHTMPTQKPAELKESPATHVGNLIIMRGSAEQRNDSPSNGYNNDVPAGYGLKGS